MKERNNEEKELNLENSKSKSADGEEVVETVSVEEECVDINSELNKLTTENERLQNQYLRAVADYTNLKKRTEKERRELLTSANANLIGKILPVIDNFERALQTISDPEVTKGVNMIYKQLIDILSVEGLEKIEAEGEQFDPHIHEALMQEQNSEVADNTVLQVFEPGYRFNNKLLRAAKVKVSSN
ncbi:nucleotide exchange factor GrpE [Clostridium sp. 'deep sea']|uniref:nucleotide exchange factor GrpE n=1 Tax=Clostridium sp. 'deep sea' TaxID=2779445 RepID=UPI001896A283|nr:nucleotide exchange factor GrpE [Clostridium sp. 'deep sea']QOR35583.1 nucleotide exchange factor GrpE [Clostridium sp. 'deep sea']